jgi:hypothetical protein
MIVVDKRTGEVYTGDYEDLVYVEELEGYIHSEDMKEFFTDDMISDISIYEVI